MEQPSGKAAIATMHRRSASDSASRLDRERCAATSGDSQSSLQRFVGNAEAGEELANAWDGQGRHPCGGDLDGER